MSRTMERAAAYWTAAAVAAVSLWASAGPSMTYPLYAAEWRLTETTTTSVFAIYPLAILVVLVLFGDLADHIGRRAAILGGLSAMFVGGVLFAVAPGIAVVFVARALMGVGVGLALSPASAAVVEFSRPGHESRASAVTTASTALGLSLATIVSGALIEYAGHPLHLSFWVLVAAILATGIAVWFLPRHTPAAETRARWRPRPVRIAPGLRLLYATSALAVSAAFMQGAVILGLGAEIVQVLVGTRNVFVVGLVLAIVSVCIGVVAILARGVRPVSLIGSGGLASVVAMALLLWSSEAGSLGLFVVGAAGGGLAYALLFAGGLGLISREAPAHHRAGTISAVYLVAYVLQGATAVALGVVATHAGLDRALWIGVPVICAFSVAACVVALALRGSQVRRERTPGRS